MYDRVPDAVASVACKHCSIVTSFVMDIIIDTTGQADLALRDQLLESDEDDATLHESGLQPASLPKKTKKKKKRVEIAEETEVKKISSMDIDLDEFERDMGWTNKRKRQPSKIINIDKLTKAIDPVEKVLAKTAIKAGFEQLETVPRYEESVKRLRRQRRMEREKTKGKKWFNMPATEVTEEIKHDLEVLQMRSALDPKRFYKKNDMNVLPKYFQIGKVVDAPLDFYNGRLTKKERKCTIVDELMANAEFAKFNKRKYKEILDEKRKLHYKAHKHARKLKDKKK